MSERDLINELIIVDREMKAEAAKVTIACKPLIVWYLDLLVKATCPNHPKSYTKEEIEAHNAKVKS